MQSTTIRAGARAWLKRCSTPVFNGIAVAAAFSAYFCMYGFRKPFAAADYDGLDAWGVDLKTALVVGQLLGYTLSKFIGIKLVSELSRRHRVAALLILIGTAELGLLGLAVLPPDAKVVAMFANGLPLGAVWGIVFSFLEGRRSTELLGAGLSVSYIVASGAVKAIGRWLLTLGVPEVWMAASVGLVFALPFVAAISVLGMLPSPDALDQQARSPRRPMNGADRAAFFKGLWPGLCLLTLLSMVLTAYRDFRDNFAVEIWEALGHGDEPALLATTEIPVALLVLLAVGLIFLVRGNRLALGVIHGMMFTGGMVISLSTLFFANGMLGSIPWMIALGVGLHLAYVPYGCVLFDRLLAATGSIGTSVFMIYVVDAMGYLGSIGLMLFRSLAQPDLPWLRFYMELSQIVGAIMMLGFALSGAWFLKQTRKEEPEARGARSAQT